MSESKQPSDGLPPPDPKLSLSLSGDRDVIIAGDVVGADRQVVYAPASAPCGRLIIIMVGVLIVGLVLVGLILILTQAMPK